MFEYWLFVLSGDNNTDAIMEVDDVLFIHRYHCDCFVSYHCQKPMKLAR